MMKSNFPSAATARNRQFQIRRFPARALRLAGRLPAKCPRRDNISNRKRSAIRSNFRVRSRGQNARRIRQRFGKMLNITDRYHIIRHLAGRIEKIPNAVLILFVQSFNRNRLTVTFRRDQRVYSLFFSRILKLNLSCFLPHYFARL